MKYKNCSAKEDEGNCQEFVEDILNELNIKPKFGVAVKDFLNRLKSKGTGDLVFSPSNEFIDKFKLKEKEVTFKSHLQLDQFVTELIKMDEEFIKNHKDEYDLLKSFDRAFWLKHLKFPMNETLIPLKSRVKSSEKISCPLKIDWFHFVKINIFYWRNIQPING